MAYNGLTPQQRARVEDACERLLDDLRAELGEAGDTVADAHLRAVEILTIAASLADTDRTELVVALRWASRDGGPVPWKRIGPAANLGRGGPERRWAELVDRRTADAEPSCYTPAAVAALPVSASA